MEIRLTDNFYLSEFTQSETAARKGIDNTPPDFAVNNLRRTAELLQQIRNKIGKPITITSGFRCPELNVAIGGAKNSDHTRGNAADFVSPSFGSAKDLAQFIISSKIPFGQIILEGNWVHISTEPKSEINRVLTAKFENGRVTYTPGI